MEFDTLNPDSRRYLTGLNQILDYLIVKSFQYFV
jgi:hypothetical protein